MRCKSAIGGPLSGFPLHGLIITKHIFALPSPGFEQVLGGHPIPNEHSLIAGQKAVTLLSRVEQNDLLLCLISGGGSALMTAPFPGIELDKLQSLTTTLSNPVREWMKSTSCAVTLTC